MRLIGNLIILFTVLALSACGGSHEFGPYMGKVVDKETGKPIEGAVVFMQFFTSTPNPGGSSSYFADAVEVLTDPKGEFEVPIQKLAVYKFLHGWKKEGSVIIFKPGYGAFPWHKGTLLNDERGMGIPESEYVTIKLPKLKTDEERRENLSNLYGDGPIDKQINLRKLRNVERKSLGLGPIRSR